MSDLIDIDAPPAPQPLSPNEAHTLAENFAAAGMAPEQIREQLRARGADPDKAITPADAARWELQTLKADPSFAAKVNAGDAEANATLNRLTMQIATGKKFEAAPVAAEDYRLPAHHPVLQAADTEVAQRFDSETRSWAAELSMQPNVAAAVAEYALDAMAERSTMSPDARANWGHGQEAMFRSVVGPDADEDIGHAERWLNAQSDGRKFDLKAIAREHGASVANEMYLHAAWLAETAE